MRPQANFVLGENFDRLDAVDGIEDPRACVGSQRLATLQIGRDSGGIEFRAVVERHSGAQGQREFS